MIEFHGYFMIPVWVGGLDQAKIEQTSVSAELKLELEVSLAKILKVKKVNKKSQKSQANAFKKLRAVSGYVNTSYKRQNIASSMTL